MYNAPDPSRVRSATFYYSDAGSTRLRLPMPLVAARRSYRESGDLPALRPTETATNLTERDWQIAQLMSQLFNLGDINHDFGAYSRIVPLILQRLASCGITLSQFNQIYNQAGWTPNEVRLAFAYVIITTCPGSTLARRALGFWGAESIEQMPALRAPDDTPPGGGLDFDTSMTTFQGGGGVVSWDKKKKTPAWPFVAGGVGILVVGGAIFLATRKKKRRRRGGRGRRRR